MRILLAFMFITMTGAALCSLCGRVFFKMPRAFDFSNLKKTGIYSQEWMDWLQARGFESIYELVIPRKLRQDRYVHSHEVNFRAVIRDRYYDTRIAEYFWTRYTRIGESEPCAMHYYRTKELDFFCITVRMDKKDEFSAIPVKEMKRLLTNEPELYLKYIPHADENKDLRALAEECI